MKPLKEVMGMFAVQLTFNVWLIPIVTDPKSRGDVQVIGNATGDPYA